MNKKNSAITLLSINLGNIAFCLWASLGTKVPWVFAVPICIGLIGVSVSIKLLLSSGKESK